MSTYDMMILFGPLTILWAIMLVGFGIVHYLDNKGV